MNASDIPSLQNELNDYDLDTRSRALAGLMALADEGEITLPESREVANMHAHTFFSFNAYGLSPSALAWIGKEEGIKLMGIVDFDVLDGVDEWYRACDAVELRGSAGLETRVFIPEFADVEINSPGEPGVAYHMGVGFASGRIPESARAIAEDLRERAQKRNLGLLQRVNAYLDPVVLDYERDVLPLTPNGNVTERHMVAAYIAAAQRQFDDPAPYWAEKLGLEADAVREMMGEDGDAPAFQNAIRKKLMKRGGVGYVQPGPDTFPTLETFHELITACGALPCAAWLDGLSQGEQRMEELLDLLIAQGVVVLNIIPDRNWNIADPELREKKLAKLYEVVALAQKLDLPVHVGTEMNSFGQKLVDDFDAPALAPLREAFMDGAYFIYGHVMMERALGRGHQSAWTQEHLPTRRDRNAFYTQVGRLVPPGKPGLTLLQGLDQTLSPNEIIEKLKEQ
jgi:hypothetical protein